MSKLNALSDSGLIALAKSVGLEPRTTGSKNTWDGERLWCIRAIDLRAFAEKLRELFPPTAKPLLWIGDRDIENEYLVRSQDRTGANWHAFVKGVFLGIGSCADEAKAMCEANNQARFLWQMA